MTDRLCSCKRRVMHSSKTAPVTMPKYRLAADGSGSVWVKLMYLELSPKDVAAPFGNSWLDVVGGGKFAFSSQGPGGEIGDSEDKAK